MTFKNYIEQRDAIIMADITKKHSKTDHLRLPLTTKSWQQPIENNCMFRVVSDKLIMRDIPDSRGHVLQELAFNTIVKSGSEESQFMAEILWKNVVYGSLKGWVLAGGIEPYTHPPQAISKNTFTASEAVNEYCRTEEEIKTKNSRESIFSE
ncbi:hypothetical protein ACO0K7_10220 [Undibacterium sp. Ji67W]|uniref:hypothetical protein n=1 Tax=Undibacterium sp. Ji67W TaxID=3413042 RepID=UPI003BF41518